MSAENTLKPVAPARVAEEVRKICGARKAGEIPADEYEHKFSRMISELRDRKIDGSRAEIMAALTPLLNEGLVNADEWARLTKQLGLV